MKERVFPARDLPTIDMAGCKSLKTNPLSNSRATLLGFCCLICFLPRLVPALISPPVAHLTSLSFFLLP